VGNVRARESKTRFVTVAVGSGLLTGTLAGLVGLGGAEERIPFILYALKDSINDMIVANLMISFATSAVNFTLRARAGLVTEDALILGSAMILGSIAGAYLGSTLSHRVSERKLKALIAFVLSLVVARLVLDLVGGVGVPRVETPSTLELPLAALFGVAIGVVSGAVGVAGGEYRIPILVFVFGFGIKIAGTTSQFVSLPTVLVALYRHRAMGFMSRESIRLATTMGAASIVGAVVGTLVLLSSGERLVEVVFAILLVYTITRLTLELRTR